MKFKTEKEAIGWVRRFMPFAIKNSKGNMRNPFISYKAHRDCCESLGRSIFENQ